MIVLHNNNNNNKNNNNNTREYRQQQQQQQQQHIKTIKIKSYHYIYYINYSLLIIILLIINGKLVRPVVADWLLDCGNCHCKWNSGKKTADCKNLSMTAVPENLSSEVQVLDLSYNRIPYLEENIFLNANLQNLHKLFIRNSTLQLINPRSFTQLEILIELDLSYNFINKLQANVFGRLVKVRALILNGNLLATLDNGIFQNLKYLHKIELKDNQLVHMGIKVFDNLPLLSQIYLDNNHLSHLRRDTFDNLKRLTALSLDQNPWNCTCDLQIFRDFVLRRNLYTPPTSCYYPKHLRGMLWVEDQPEAFACKPNIIYPLQGASIYSSKENVTLICRVHASQNTLIAWDFNKQLYRANNHAFSSSSSSTDNGPGSGAIIGPLSKSYNRIQIQLERDDTKDKEYGRNIFISRLTILNAEKSDEGVYTCIAENAGGKESVQMNLLVEKPGNNPHSLLLHGNLITVISLMTLALFTIAVFLALVTCCIYKRFKVIEPSPPAPPTSSSSTLAAAASAASQQRQHHHHHHYNHDKQQHYVNQIVNANGSEGDISPTPHIEGRTNVILSIGSDGNRALGNIDRKPMGNNLKHHLHQKTTLNFDGHNENKAHNNECDKYDEVLVMKTHNSAEGPIQNVTIKNNDDGIMSTHYQQQLLTNLTGKCERGMDKACMEQNTPGNISINVILFTFLDLHMLYTTYF